MESNKNNNKKIVILGIVLLILAGIIIIALKGVNVSLMFGKHEAIEIKLEKEVTVADMNQICNEVFDNKKFVVKGLEVFLDSIQINVESITDEEKNNLIEKINEKYETSKSVDDLKVFTVSNKRIRDVVKDYIKPMIISFAIILIYMLIRYRKINAIKIIIDFFFFFLLTEAILLSVVAITRFPVSNSLINLFMVLVVVELIYYISQSEKKLEKIDEK